MSSQGYLIEGLKSGTNSCIDQHICWRPWRGWWCRTVDKVVAIDKEHLVPSFVIDVNEPMHVFTWMQSEAVTMCRLLWIAPIHDWSSDQWCLLRKTKRDCTRSVWYLCQHTGKESKMQSATSLRYKNVKFAISNLIQTVYVARYQVLGIPALGFQYRLWPR